MGRFLFWILLLGCRATEQPKDWDSILRQAVEERGLRAGIPPQHCCADHDSLRSLLEDAFITCRTYYNHGRKDQAAQELDAILESFHRTRPCIDTDPPCRMITDLVRRMEQQLSDWLTHR